MSVYILYQNIDQPIELEIIHRLGSDVIYKATYTGILRRKDCSSDVYGMVHKDGFTTIDASHIQPELFQILQDKTGRLPKLTLILGRT